MEQIKEDARGARGTAWLEDALRDIRYGSRLLRRLPIFSSVAVLWMVLGVGVTTAVFTLVDRVLRMALGARAPRVLRMVLHQTAALALAGCVIGAAGAWALSRFATGFLFGIRPAYPLSFLMAIATLLLVPLGASYLPGRSASHTDPVKTLRAE